MVGLGGVYAALSHQSHLLFLQSTHALDLENFPTLPPPFREVYVFVVCGLLRHPIS